MEFGLHSANNAEELCFVLLGRGVGLLQVHINLITVGALGI